MIFQDFASTKPLNVSLFSNNNVEIGGHEVDLGRARRRTVRLSAIDILLDLCKDRSYSVAYVLEIPLLGAVLGDDRRIIRERINGVPDELIVLVDAVMDEPPVLQKLDEPVPHELKACCIQGTDLVDQSLGDSLLNGFERH